VVSGGVELNVSWTPYNVSTTATATAAASAAADGKTVGDNRTWTTQDNYNYVWNADIGSKTIPLLAKGVTSAAACQVLCDAAPDCHAYTWHDKNTGGFKFDCVGRTDGRYEHHGQGHHFSGHDATATPIGPSPSPHPGPSPPPPAPPTPPPNVYVADVKGQVSSITGLQLDGARATRARYPNLPGGLEVSCGYGCMMRAGDAQWTPPDTSKYAPVKYYTDQDHFRNDTIGTWFQHYMIGVDGLCGVYDPPVSYWCSQHPSGGGAFAFRTPSGITPEKGALPNMPYKDPSTALFNVWRPSRWSNWMFEVDTHTDGTYKFGRGGNQGARGNDKGGDWFIENVFEELDYPGEFYYDALGSKLYHWYNGTGAPPAATKVVAPEKQILVNMTGTQWNPIKNVTISNIKYTASAYTYMERHAVPSAGDWALDRFGAIFLQGTEGVTMENCTFDRLDGNAVMVSGYNRNATVTNSDFSFIGGNAVVSWGYTNETDTDPGRPGVAIANAPQAGIDGTDGEHPRFTTVTSCTGREIGLYEKQSSFFIMAKSSENVVRGNVFFNGPRAGINANDGFGGGDDIGYNLVFSTCRESGDHGPFNSWDRQPFLTTVRTGKPDLIMAWRNIHHNFFVDNYSPQEDVDNDDGSCFYKTHDNFLVYGGRAMKNDFGGHDNHHFGNIYGYVGEGPSVSGTLDGDEDLFTDNYVVMTGEDVGKMACTAPGKTVMSNNQYFTQDGSITECGTSLAKWQAASPGNNDAGSNVTTLPTDAAIIARVKAKLGFV